MATKNDVRAVIRLILNDIRVEMADEFGRNFERQAFFTEAWKRRKHGDDGRGILVKTGALRRSVKAKSDDRSVTFSSGRPYAAIHNEGGEIRVTAKMKRYFWARYISAKGSMGRKKNGELRATKKNERLTAEAEFWKLMALMKVGSVIKIPRRQFIGMHPELERTFREIIENELKTYFDNLKLE